MSEHVHDEQVIEEAPVAEQVEYIDEGIAAATLRDYWGPVIDVLEGSQANKLRVDIIGTDAKNQVYGYVVEIAEDWVVLEYAGADKRHYVARHDISRVIHDISDYVKARA